MEKHGESGRLSAKDGEREKPAEMAVSAGSGRESRTQRRAARTPWRHYGIDMASRAELVGADLTVEEIREFVGADSLHYISLDGLIEATPDARSQLCTACFTGEYPIPVPGEHEQLAQIGFDFDTLGEASKSTSTS